MSRPVFATALLFLLACGDAVLAQAVLFRDDFNGASLDQTKWSVGDWTFDGNRAVFGNTPTVSGGIGRLRLDTFNPNDRGHSFLGTEIYSNQEFTRGTGLELEARVRTNAMPSGLVTSFFSYTPNGDETSDEIDFEVLSKEMNSAKITGSPVLLSSWNDANHTPAEFDDGVHHTVLDATVPNLNLKDFNTFTIRWLPDHTEWLINGQVVRSTTEALANAPMPVRLNFWAPDNSWPEAYNSSLAPARNAHGNRSYYYDVDYVTVRSITAGGPDLRGAAVPEPAGILQLILGALGSAWLVTRRRPRPT